MNQDKEILLFPILSSVASIILFLIFVFPFFLTYLITGVLGKESTIWIYLSIFAFYFIVAFTATFFNAGIVYIAKTRFAGGDATLGDGIRAGFKHIKPIIYWSLISATVGLILNILESQTRERKGIAGLLGRIAISLVGMAWAIVSVFVVPAMVIKNQGPIEALKSSVGVIKKTWGESLIRYYGLNIAKSIFLIAGVIFLLVPAIVCLISTFFALGLMLIGIFILYFMLVLVIFSSANTIFNTALFIYANEGKVPRFYSKEELSHAFRKK